MNGAPTEDAHLDSALVPLVWHALHERFQFERALDRGLEFNSHARVRVFRWVTADSGAHRLAQRVAVGAAALRFVADAAVEIVAAAALGLERDAADDQKIVDELGD